MFKLLFALNFCVAVYFTINKMGLTHTLYGSFQLTLVLIFTYILMGLRGVNKMVDVVTNRLFDTFSRFNPRESQQHDSLSTISNLKRFGDDKRNQRVVIRQSEKRAREDVLYDIKENAASLADPEQRPLLGLSCHTCTPSSRDSLINKTISHLGLKNILENHNYRKNGILQRTFSHLSEAYELGKFKYPQVAGTVLKENRLKDAIEKAAIEQFQDTDDNDEDFYQQLLKNQEKRARKLLKDMRSTLSDFLLRFTSWVLYKLLPCFLSSVVVHTGQIKMLKEAGNTGIPLIFLPLHRSHLDYILISFILLNNNVRSPLVAAGDNLRIPFFGSLLRGLGAFFIKRRIDPIMGRKDHVYKAVLHTYMNECLRAGHNIEFFLEGGRTRTGKPCMPKYGILSVILDAFMEGTIEDALLVPVSVNYEKLVDGNFVCEQLGQPKQMETFGAAMKGIWHVLNSNYGMMRIDFNQPFSMRELVKTFNTTGKMPPTVSTRKLKSNPSTTSLYGTDIVSEDYKYLVESISRHIIYDCAKTTAIMSTNALAFLLLNKFRQGGTLEQLARCMDDLRDDLIKSKRDLGFSGDSVDVIYYAVDVLGPGLVLKEKINNEEIIKPVAILPNVIELTYYSNTLLSHYVLESIIATALYSLDISIGMVTQENLVNSCMDLCDIMQYEFLLHKPCQDIQMCINDTIDTLIMRRDIFFTENQNLSIEGRRIPQYFDDDDDEAQPYCSVKYQISKSEAVVEILQLLRTALRPIVSAYSVTALCLDKLIGRTLLESDLIREVIDEMKRQLEVGELTEGETVSVDSVKNALKLFQKWDILECHNESKLRVYYLKETYDDVASVQNICKKIDIFRYGFTYKN